MSGDYRAAVELATMAPSIHNTQPWRFRLGDDRIEVLADRSRQLPVIDPTGRQLCISCGAATEHLRLGVRSLDRAATVEILPDPATPDLLAVVHVGAESPVEPAERALIREIPRRHTHREAFDNRPLPGDLVEELRQGVASYDAWLRPFERPDDLVTVAVLLSRADETQRADVAYQEELRSWLRLDEDAPADGIPSTALPPTPVHERHSSLLLRDFDLDRVLAGETTAEEIMPPAERPFVAALGTEHDDAHAWLQAGRALGWLLVRAAAAGVAASPLNQVLDLSGTRARFAHELSLVGHPHMLLRMGYATGHPTTPRRDVNDVLI